MSKGTYKRTKEHKKRMSERLRGTNNPMYGKKHSDKSKRKISEALKGRKKSPFSKEHKRKLSLAMKGKQLAKGKHWKLSLEERKKRSKREKGENNPNWRGGITPENARIRAGNEFRLWREAIFARDNWTCQKCEKRGIKLQSHHIRNFNKYPDLRFAIDNGIAFCENCHREFHKQYGHTNDEQQIKEFLGEKLSEKVKDRQKFIDALKWNYFM